MASILQQIAFPWSDPITSGLAADYLSWAFLMIVHLPISFGLIADRFYGLLFVCYGLVKKWASTKGKVESFAKLKGLEIDAINQHYTV
jgi:hypothetical protein